MARARDDAAGHPPGGVGIDPDRHAATPRTSCHAPPFVRRRCKTRRYRRTRPPMVRGRWCPAPVSAGPVQTCAGRGSWRAILSRARTKMPGSVRLWLVSTAIAMSLVGQPADRRPEAEQPPGVAEGAHGRRSRRRWTPRPYGTRRLVRARSGRCRPASRRPTPGSSTLARVQRPCPAREVARCSRRWPPAPPAAVTTEVNGTTGVPSDRSMALGVLRGRTRTGSRGRRSAWRASVGWYQVWRRPSGLEEAGPDLLAERRRADALGEQAEDEVVRVRVVPAARPAWKYGLPTYFSEVSACSSAVGVAQERAVDRWMEEVVAQAARVVEQLADRDLGRDLQVRQVRRGPARRGR